MSKVVYRGAEYDTEKRIAYQQQMMQYEGDDANSTTAQHDDSFHDEDSHVISGANQHEDSFYDEDNTNVVDEEDDGDSGGRTATLIQI